jgi:hypothetical protein
MYLSFLPNEKAKQFEMESNFEQLNNHTSQLGSNMMTI